MNTLNNACIEYSYDAVMTETKRAITNRSDAAIVEVSAIAILTMVGNVWTPRTIDGKGNAAWRDQEDIARDIAALPMMEAKSKSGRNQYIAVGQALARHLRDHFGDGLIVATTLADGTVETGRNAFWDDLLANVNGEPVTAAHTIARLVSWLKAAPRSCAYFADVAAMVMPDKAAGAKKTMVETVVAALDKMREKSPEKAAGQAEALALAILPYALELQGIADMVTARQNAVRDAEIARQAAAAEIELAKLQAENRSREEQITALEAQAKALGLRVAA